MGVLQAPVYELKQDSQVYKDKKLRKDSQSRINEIIANISEEFGFIPDHFAYYSSQKFGFEKHTPSYKEFKTYLTKSSDHNGIHTFKKNTKLYKEISEKMKELDAINKLDSPWALHDIFGLNRARAMQWIGDRYFVEVKEGQEDKIDLKKAEKVNYKDYLELVTQYIDD